MITSEPKTNFVRTRHLLAACVGVLIVQWPLLSGETQSSGIQTHRIESPFQHERTNIRILLPDHYDKETSYRVLYVLPVVANDERRYGGGLSEILKHNYHNAHQLICVAPEFTSKPWYADHSDNMGRQDESHLLKTVLPYIDSRFSTLKAKEGRLLIGFSKSGWGAMSLLLRHPDVFYKAAAWDSGIRVDTGPIDEQDRARRIKEYFGSPSNFEKHRISNLIKTRGKSLGHEERLFYYNTEGTRAQGGVELHRLMIETGIPHRYCYDTGREHRWDSGWIPLAIEFLVETTVVN
jgi:enterochelin esterase-like enzyme